MPDDDVLRDELARLLEPGGEPDTADVLDVLWIARLSGLGPVAGSLLGADRDAAAAAPASDRSPPTVPEPGPVPDSGPVSPSARLHLPGGYGAAQAATGGAHTIRVAQPSALPDVLSLSRALRPLRQTVASTRVRILDTQATAAASGGMGLLLPVLRSAPERRFSVDLLIDVGTTMAVWHRLAGELRTLLERQGAFADVRCWALHTDEPEPRLAPFRRGVQAARTTRRWRETLADPSGRRVVLVLTDGVGPAWYGGELPAALARWSRERPVAALQVLPSRLWHRTALRTVPARARGTEAFRATIEVRSSGPLSGIARGGTGNADRARIRWLPVLEVSGAWLGPWARLVSGRATDWTPLRAAALTVVDRPLSPLRADEPGTPADWIERFEAGYSPEAFGLLRLLAAAPLSLPVMRLVQRTQLPSLTPMHLAEIFLSGLLVRRTPAEPGEDPDAVLYDFRAGVREALLARLTRTESVRVLEQVYEGVSERVAATLGGVNDFRALMDAGAGGGLGGLELPEESRAFAEVAVAVFRGAGGDYGDIAARLSVGGAKAAVGLAEAVDEARPRERGGGLFRWWPRRPRAEAEAVGEGSASGGVKPVHDGTRVATRIPVLPKSYVRRGATSHVVEVLGGATPAAASEYPVRDTTMCVIEGAPGVGKTALAVGCARELAAEFTMVRWLRAHSQESLVDDLVDLAVDLGLVPVRGTTDPADLLAGLRTYLREHPGWLLICDGVTREALASPQLDLRLWSPLTGYGSVLVTLSEGAHWEAGPYETVTLDDFSPSSATVYLHSALARERGELWNLDSVLTDLVEVVGTRPLDLAVIVSAIKNSDSPVDIHVQSMLLDRTDTSRFLRSLVWITQSGTFLGTGVAVRPDAVLTATAVDLESGLLQVHQEGGQVYDVSSCSTQHLDAPGLFLLMLADAVLPPVFLAHPETGADAVAVWHSPPGRGWTTAPGIRLRPGSAAVDTLPEGTALIDSAGSLRSLVTATTEGVMVAIDVTPGLVNRLAARFEGRRVQARVREPTVPRSPRQAPYFYLSYARTPSWSAGERILVQRFFTDLSRNISELTASREPVVGFLDENLPLGSNWQEEMRLALASARVLVPLYSRHYFNSTWCGMEWDAFGRRHQRDRRGTTHERPAVVPVLWTVAEEMRLPPVAERLPYIDPRDVSRYSREGVKGLLESGKRSAQYRHVVKQIAEAVVEVAETTHLSPYDVSLLDDLRNVFEDPEQD